MNNNVLPVWLLEYAVKSLQSPEDIITDDVLHLYNSFINRGFSENFTHFATALNLGRWALKSTTKEKVVKDILTLPIDFNDVLRCLETECSIEELILFLLDSDRRPTISYDGALWVI